MPWGLREGFLEEVMSEPIRSQCERRCLCWVRMALSWNSIQPAGL